MIHTAASLFKLRVLGWVGTTSQRSLAVATVGIARDPLVATEKAEVAAAADAKRLPCREGRLWLTGPSNSGGGARRGFGLSDSGTVVMEADTRCRLTVFPTRHVAVDPWELVLPLRCELGGAEDFVTRRTARGWESEDLVALDWRLDWLLLGIREAIQSRTRRPVKGGTADNGLLAFKAFFRDRG